MFIASKPSWGNQVVQEQDTGGGADVQYTVMTVRVRVLGRTLAILPTYQISYDSIV
jgi:hypothetical protein